MKNSIYPKITIHQIVVFVIFMLLVSCSQSPGIPLSEWASHTDCSQACRQKFRTQFVMSARIGADLRVPPQKSLEAMPSFYGQFYRNNDQIDKEHPESIYTKFLLEKLSSSKTEVEYISRLVSYSDQDFRIVEKIGKNSKWLSAHHRKIFLNLKENFSNGQIQKENLINELVKISQRISSEIYLLDEVNIDLIIKNNVYRNVTFEFDKTERINKLMTRLHEMNLSSSSLLLSQRSEKVRLVEEIENAIKQLKTAGGRLPCPGAGCPAATAEVSTYKIQRPSA